MGPDAFTVEPAALRQLADHFLDLVEQLDAARSLTQQVDTAGFGHDKLTRAAEHFVGHWAYQAQQIGTIASDTGTRLHQAASQYDTVEQSQLTAQGQGTTT